jgi:integrase
MLECGLRVSEACALLWADVDMRQGVVRVRHGKGDKARVVPVTWTTLRALADDAGDGAWVLYPINRPRRQTTRRTIGAALARVGADLGIVLHPHRLRHTYACELLAAGVNIYDLAQLLGHSSIATTEVYLHVQPDELAGRLRAAMEPPTTPQSPLPMQWAA